MIEALAWDSKFWGFPIGMLRLEASDTEASEPSSADLDGYGVVQTRIDLATSGIARRLSGFGFFPVATRVELERVVAPLPVSSALSAHGPDCEWTDHMEGADMAVYAMQFVELSRFRAFPVSIASIASFYRTWIENALAATFDDGLVHLLAGGVSAGFSTYRIREGRLVIGLVAVSPQFQRQGVLGRLISKLDDIARERSAHSLILATEGANIRARRGYVRHGFKPVSDTLWLYRIR